MVLLSIIDKEAFFSLEESQKKSISEITNEDINKALKVILSTDDIDLALGADVSTIANPAQRIIFEQLRSSFKEVVDSRKAILEEIDETFAAAEAKYLKQD